MSDVVNVEYMDSVYMKVTADASTRHEISEFFSFKPEGYQFHPSYKARYWDGVIRLYNPMRPVLYVGLLEKLKQFCEVRDYELRMDTQFQETECESDYGYELAKEIKCKFEPRDYQNDYVVNAIRKKRSLSVSPTSSGKSLIIYLIQQHYYNAYNHRTLIIVPTIGLVHQMKGDFIDYGCDPDIIYTIQGGVDKNTSAPIVISTWQSLIKLDKEWFDQFRVVLGDEAHLFQAKSLTKIMEKLTDCDYRHGFTGTLKSSESKTHRMVLEGSFGPVVKFVSTKDLMDEGTIADFNVKAIILSHNKEARKVFKDAINKVDTVKKYPAEREFIVNHPKRNMFIRNLLWSLEGQNNLVLFDLVEKHGKILEPLLQKEDR
jgi:superfamily II DNA or RNA helicase